MDTVTHALAGALAGRASTDGMGRNRLSAGRAAWAMLVACTFPDFDFIIALFDPYAYLVYHRLLTHSLVLMPIWALGLAALFGLLDKRFGWRDYLPYMLVGLALHILMDVFNIWPLQPLWPLSEWTVAAPVLFVIDPIYTGIVVLGLTASALWRSQASAFAALVLVGVYTAIQFPLNAHAQRSVSAPGTVTAYGQPYSPLHRRLVVERDDGLSWAYLRQLANGPWGGYQPLHDLEWTHALHPMHAGELVAQAWLHDDLRVYRGFATRPYVYSVGTDGSAVCVWFADVRFTLPGMPPAFRYGMCRHTDGAWTRHRRGRW